MPLDPQAQFLLEQMAALNMPAMSTQTPEQVREGIKMQRAMVVGDPEPVAHVENRTMPGPAVGHAGDSSHYPRARYRLAARLFLRSGRCLSKRAAMRCYAANIGGTTSLRLVP